MTLARVFRFPASIEGPCAQYLSYFAKFLRDVGVDASTKIESQAGRILFSVTPKGDAQALELVRHALEAYLALPQQQITVAGAQGPAEMQLHAAILHLKSQLMLAQATIQAQSAAIQLLECHRPALAEPKRTEDLVPGIVRLGEYERAGVTVDLGELLRRLKRRLIDP